jgi:hypothetical protein
MLPYTLKCIVFDFAGDNERSRSAIRTLRKLYPTFTLKDFASHELYRDPKNLDRVVGALRKAGLPERPVECLLRANPGRSPSSIRWTGGDLRAGIAARNTGR